MDQTYAYEEDPNEEGLTLKKVGHFLKKSWLRMLIYAVVLAAVASVIVLPIKFLYKSEPVAETSIEFIYKGAEKGLTPDGGTLDTDDIISPNVLAKAVDAAGLSDTVKDISVLRAAMRVEPVTTKEYRDLVAAAANGDATAQEKLDTYTNYPTRFDIIISDPDELGLSDTDAKQLLDKVVSEYYADFKSTYSREESFSTEMYNLSSNKTWEFTKIYDEYMTSLTEISNELSRLNREAPTFASTAASATFSQLLSELNTLKLSYENFNDYILGKNVWRDKDVAYINLSDSRARVTNDIAAQEELAAQYNANLQTISPTTVTTTANGTTTTVSAPAEDYYKYLDMTNEANALVASLKNQLANIEIRINTVTDGQDPGHLDAGSPAPSVGPLTPTPAADITTAETQLASIETNSMSFVGKVNAAITDYYDTTFISSSIKQVRPSVVSRKSSDLNILIIYVVVLIAGALVGGIVTGVKISKANSAAKAGASSETTAAREDVAETSTQENAAETSENKDATETPAETPAPQEKKSAKKKQ